MNFDFEKGEVLFIDKPLQWTSFNIVQKIKSLIRHSTGIKNIKVGHAGTLDPLASGLMIVCTGSATKSILQYQNLSKEYLAEMTLGATTPSFDLETAIDNYYPVDHIDEQKLREALQLFKGKTLQVPPIFSAKQVNGKRAYNLARKGKSIELAPVEVTIDEIELLSTFDTMPVVHFRTVCSKGTYIRALAYDLGEALQSGAHLTNLRRTKIGDFSVNDALSISEFEKKLTDK